MTPGKSFLNLTIMRMSQERMADISKESIDSGEMVPPRSIETEKLFRERI
jgi:hypothetical protein